MDWFVPLVALAVMEIVLGIDNLVFIAIVTSKLPPEKQSFARRVGLGLALGMRILLLCTLSWILSLKNALFTLTSIGIPENIIKALSERGHDAVHAAQEATHNFTMINEVSMKDLILIGGGLFLIAKSVHEIHEKFDGKAEGHGTKSSTSVKSALIQIMILDIIFSLDSVITAVGMADDLWVMIAAVILAVGVMIVFANPVSNFVERHPTLTMLALSFLILIGVMLVAEGIGTHVDKGYIYFAMAFAIGVEFLNMRIRGPEVLKHPEGARA